MLNKLINFFRNIKNILDYNSNIVTYKKIEYLKKKGLKIGENFSIGEQCIIDPSHCWHIEIGNNVTLAPKVHILAHDASTKRHLGYTKLGNIIIKDKVFIGAGSIILPGVTIGENSIIGAGSIVSNDIPKNCVFAGNPARKIYTLDEYLNKHKINMDKCVVFERDYLNPDIDKKNYMKRVIENKIGYIV